MILPKPQILAKLTPAEEAVLTLLKKGYANQLIAAELGLRVGTVKYHLTSIYKKMAVKSDRQLLAKFFGASESEQSEKFSA